ncbi:MAG: hypothetical protein IKC93_06620 [Candidatus Methanomethylophilaceae archaeon]|nr:hypothetical protein [Candidatus Methanomethylophilaceae archaeon]MBR7124517.1 hypothetical protein [Candidatus Methanomethylophilaceae archaeon]
MHHDDHDDDEYKYDYDHVEIDHDSDNKDIKGDDFNPVEEGSALHLEIHRAVDELGKYAIELELMPKDGISKEKIKEFIDEVMRKPTLACLENGADIIGHVKSMLIVGDKGSIMSSIVDENRPTKMTDAVEVDVIDDAILVLHIIVHGLWDDKIRELTLPLIEEVCAKWGIGYKILADYFDVEKSIAHHELPGQ